jgi:hypothetical protein
VDGKLVARLVERVAKAEHVAVPEDREDPGEEWRLATVDDRPLRDEKADDRLRRGESHAAHVGPSEVVSGHLGSVSCELQVPRIQAYAGSSTKAMSLPAEPAMTFR